MLYKYIFFLLLVCCINNGLSIDAELSEAINIINSTESGNKSNEKKVEDAKDSKEVEKKDVEKKSSNSTADSELLDAINIAGSDTNKSAAKKESENLNVFDEDRVYVKDDSGGLFDEIDQATNKYDFKKLDPYENWNKQVFSFNLFLFRNTLLPFIFFVDAWVPKPIIHGYKNFNKNLAEPRNYIVHMMRHDKERARLAARRFFINTIFGALGFIDVAGRKYKNYSKVMTFDCVFRKSQVGNYIISPITNQYYGREYSAQTLDWFTNPVFYINFPFNYLVYIIDQSISLLPNKALLYKNRKYSDLTYKNLRDIETDLVFNDVNCLG